MMCIRCAYSVFMLVIAQPQNRSLVWPHKKRFIPENKHANLKCLRASCEDSVRSTGNKARKKCRGGFCMNNIRCRFEISEVTFFFYDVSNDLCAVCLQCPPDTPKSRRAAENDLLENTFHQVNNRPSPHTHAHERKKEISAFLRIKTKQRVRSQNLKTEKYWENCLPPWTLATHVFHHTHKAEQKQTHTLKTALFRDTVWGAGDAPAGRRAPGCRTFYQMWVSVVVSLWCSAVDKRFFSLSLQSFRLFYMTSVQLTCVECFAYRALCHTWEPLRRALPRCFLWLLHRRLIHEVLPVYRKSNLFSFPRPLVFFIHINGTYIQLSIH